MDTSALIIDSRKFSFVANKLRDFFLKEKGFIEVHTQNRLSILAACEDVTTISTFNFADVKYPLPQTGQMWLERELLDHPEANGYFCLSTSFRNEPNPIPAPYQICVTTSRGGAENGPVMWPSEWPDGHSGACS